GAECQLIKKHDLRLDDCYAIDVRVNSSPSLGVAAAAAGATATTNPSPGSTGGTSSSKEEVKSSSSSNSYAAAVKTEGESFLILEPKKHYDTMQNVFIPFTFETIYHAPLNSSMKNSET
ncbi:hypothetical protein FF38_01552, partial [Lucilia cuprina]